MKKYSLSQKAELITGLTIDQVDYVVVGTKDKVIVLKIVGDAGNQYKLEPLASGTKNIPEFRSLAVFGTNRIAAVSDTQFY